MKKAIIAFTVLLVLSLISTVCFAAATGTKIFYSAIDYLNENDIHSINDLDKLEERFEGFVRDKLGVDLDVDIDINDNSDKIEEENEIKNSSALPDITEQESTTAADEITEQQTENDVGV